MELGNLVGQLGALVGVGALVAALVNIGKSAGLVKDGQAQVYSTGLNLVALVALFALKVWAPQIDVANLDATAGQIANAALVVFGLLVQLYGAKWAHGALTGVPGVGKSFSH